MLSWTLCCHEFRAIVNINEVDEWLIVFDSIDRAPRYYQTFIVILRDSLMNITKRYEIQILVQIFQNVPLAPAFFCPSNPISYASFIVLSSFHYG